MSRNTIDLSTPLEQTLLVVAHEYRDTDSPVASSRIAEILDRHPGTIKNQMQQLVAFELVESVRGPKGGYEPTEKALELLEQESTSGSEPAVVAGEYQRVAVEVDEIDLTNVHHPTECHAHVHFLGTVEHLEVGDPILVGPTPVFDLVIGGRIRARSETADELLVDVSHAEAPLTDEFEG